MKVSTTIRKIISDSTTLDEVLQVINHVEKEKTFSREEKEDLVSELFREKTLHIIACGLMGAGKSTLLNGLIGDDAFKVGNTLDHETCELKKVAKCEDNYTIIACDSPGLDDSTDNMKQYIEAVQIACEDDMYIALGQYKKE